MIKNTIHYQITGDINADFGSVITNPIIKIAVSPEGAVNDGLLQCEYNIYKDAAAYSSGKHFFKAEKDDKRLTNFTYPVANSEFYSFALGLTNTPPTENALEAQRKIIADTFGLDISNVVLVEEV